MAHELQDVEDHHEGDAARLDVTAQVDGEILDLTGASATWLLIEDEDEIEETITEEHAKLVKSGEEGADEEEIEFTDPPNGELEVAINTDDTAGHVNWAETDEPAEFDHRLRVTDAGDERTTQFTGTFEIYK